jgi:hypothetical protein
MTVTLNRAYSTFPAGQVVTLPSSTEAALIAQGLATAAAATATTVGANTAAQLTGIAAIAAGASSVVITNPLVDAGTFVSAVVSQAAADTTLLRVERVVSAAGSFTVFGTANATATTLIKWAIVNPSGEFPLN